jgi:hypothetical protein
MSIIEIKATLENIEPAITRTLQVPSNVRGSSPCTATIAFKSLV